MLGILWAICYWKGVDTPPPHTHKFFPDGRYPWPSDWEEELSRLQVVKPVADGPGEQQRGERVQEVRAR